MADSTRSPQEDHEPQISLPADIFISIVCAAADIADILVAGSGIPLGDIIAFPTTQIYLMIKGIDGRRMLMGNLGELPPLLDALPIRTVMWRITVSADRHPNVEEALEIAAHVMPKSAAGGVPGKVTGSMDRASAPTGVAMTERVTRLPLTTAMAGETSSFDSTHNDSLETQPKKIQRGIIEETSGAGEKFGEEGMPQGATQATSGLEELGWGRETRRVIETLERTPDIEDIEGRSPQKEPRVRLYEDKNTIDLKNAKQNQ